MIVCTMPECQTTAGCGCTGLVRHRNPEKFAGDPDFYPKEVARLTAVLEAAQARIEAVRREAIAECALVAEERAKDRVTLYSDRSREPHEIKALEAQHTAAAIRALTEAKEEK